MRPEGLKFEAMTESGKGVLGEGAASSLPPARGSRGAASSPAEFWADLLRA